MKKTILLMLLFTVMLISSVYSALIDDQIAYYKEDTNGFFDDSENNYNGTLVNAPTFITPGKIGSAYDFDGINQHVNLGNITELSNIAQFTIDMWVYPDDVAGTRYFFAKRTDANNVVWAQTGAGNWIYFLAYFGGANAYIRTNNALELTTGSWQYIAFVYNGSNAVANDRLKMYIDGSLVATTVNNGPIAVTTPIFSNNFQIGSNSLGTASYYDGDIDEVGIWINKSLTISEIEERYAAGLGKQWPYGVTTPTFTTIYETPSNNTHNNTNLITYYKVVDTTNTPINCSLYINDTLNKTTGVITVNTSLYFNVSFTVENIYNYYIGCSNETESSNTSQYTFYYDTTSPFIYINSPFEDNTTTFNFSNRTLNLNIFTIDDFLYKANLTIFNASGYQMYNNYSGVLTGVTRWNWTSTINMSTWPVGHYDILPESDDYHTDKSIKEGFNPIKEKATKIKYKTPKEWGETEYSIEYIGSSKIKKYEDIQYIDRHSLNITFDKETLEKDNKVKDKIKFRWEEFKIISDKPLLNVKNSIYPCHLVSKNGLKGLWSDCVYNGSENDIQYLEKISDYEYITHIYTDNDIIIFESLGGLNYNSKWVSFEILQNLTIYANDTNTGLFIENFTVTYNGNTYNSIGNKSIVPVVVNTTHSIMITKAGYSPKIDNIFIGFKPKTVNFNLSSAGVTLYFYEEINQTLLTNITITSEIIGNITNTYTTTTGIKTISGLNAGDYEIRYYATGYNPRSRYLNLNFTGVSNYNLTMLANSQSNVKTIKIIDQDSNIIEDVLIKMYRDYPTGFIIINEAYTNFEGETISNFVEDTTYYKFLIYQDDNLIKETGKTLISSAKSTLSIQIPITEDQLQSIRYFLPATHQLTGPSNATGKTCYTFSWAGANLKGAKLIVKKTILSSDDILVLENTSTLAAGSLDACFIPESNFNYFIDGYIDTNTSNSFFPVQQKEYSLQNTVGLFGFMGLLLSYVVIVGLMLLSSGHPSGSIVLGVLGLIFVAGVGFFSITYGVIILIIAVAVLIIFLNKT